MNSRVAVIDIGSNSIKCLVAARSHNGDLQTLFTRTLETRISQGITGTPPRLRSDRIQAGVEAVATLWQDCLTNGPLHAHRIVATSAVRDAANRDEFCNAVYQATGQHTDVLSGDDEAAGIASGIAEDPAIRGRWNAFTLFDLGGGSLECIRFADGKIQQRKSFPLGAVRLTEACSHNPNEPISPSAAQRIQQIVIQNLAENQFMLTAPVVACGGGVAVARAILAELKGVQFAQHSRITIQDLNELYQLVALQTLSDRLKIKNIPANRADILPAALIVFQTLLSQANAQYLTHSLYNLRYGIAASLLG